MKRLNVGCGKDIRKDYINLDSVKLEGVDIVYDLNKYPWTFKKNQFDYILCDNILEHLDSIIKPLEEIHRITKKEGIIEIIVPLAPN